MDAKFVKTNIQKKQAKNDLHISGIAGMAFGILLVLTVRGVLFMDGRIADAWIGMFVAGMQFSADTFCLPSK